MKKLSLLFVAASLISLPLFAQTSAPSSAPAAVPVTKAPAVVTPAVKPAAPATVANPAAANAGGVGKVWVNGKVYHCMGTKHYGKTKQGSFMTEAEAKAQGAHASHGKACQ